MIKRILIFNTLLIGVLVGQACSDIRLGSIKLKSQPPPETPATWSAPTITQAQCDALVAPGWWEMTDANLGLNFLCGAFKDKEYTLAPEMKFFLSSDLNLTNFDMNTEIFYQTENGLVPQTGDLQAANNTLSHHASQLSKMQGKITYKKISGPQNILAPLGVGAIYSVTTPEQEGDYVYGVQAETKYGVSAVKKITIHVKKSGIEPVTAPQCPGFSNTVFLDLDKYIGGRLLTKHFGKFGPQAAYVIKFTVPENGQLNIQSTGNGWIYSDKLGNMSTRPCDFESNQGTFYNKETIDNVFNLAYFSKDIKTSKRTFFINIKNLDTPGGCGAQGYTDCAQHVDYNFMRTLASDTGTVVKHRTDWGGGNDCYGGSGQRERTYAWSAALNAYDFMTELSCQQGAYIDPYYAK